MIIDSPRRPVVDLTFFAPFSGIGVGARGFLDAQFKAGGVDGRWVCLGGVDSDEQANRNASRLCGSPFATLDLFTRDQYEDFHGKEPPQEWREATPDDIFKAAGRRFPDALMLSPPCKGYSTLLPKQLSKSKKYVALNGLGMRGIWLCLEAFKERLPHLILIENVPLAAHRGRRWLDQISSLLNAYGYSVAETVHDCGHLGGLAQSRKRFLLVARRMETVPNYLYQPPAKPMVSISSVLGKLPLPGTNEHPLHQLPKLAFKTWARLAFVREGMDWRSLDRLRVIDGQLADYGMSHAGGAALPVPDVRYSGKGEYSQYGVMGWSDTSPTISGQSAPGGGRYSVADPRVTAHRWASELPGFGPVYSVTRKALPSLQSTLGSLPQQDQQISCVIVAEDGTWHRPLSTLETAALQSMFDPERYQDFMIHGTSDRQIREWVGNAIPRLAAKAMGEAFGQALLLSRTEQTFILREEKVWVQPLILALQYGYGGAQELQ